MGLPERSREEITAAIRRFDSELRDTVDWQNWEQNKAYRYAIEYEGKRYPVKQIVSLSTGTPVGEFNGGGPANTYVRDRGFRVVVLHLPQEAPVAAALHDLLLRKHPEHVFPADAYRELADQFEIPEERRRDLMDDGRTVHWENRVLFARRRLVDAGVLDNSIHTRKF